MKKANFRSDIQGLRAVAILSVVLFHLFPTLIPGGFVGVDIFFVISGYVITQTILRGLEDGSFTFAGFYRRRIRRLFPAMVVVLTFVMIAGYLVLPPLQLKETARNVASTVAFISNYDFYRLSGYFDGPSELRPLLHTWSLSVEEQFYFVYPALLCLAWRRGRNRLPAVIASAFVVALVGGEAIFLRSPEFAFYLSPARFCEFLLGAAVAVQALQAPTDRALANAAFLLGVALLVASFALYDGRTPFPGLSALLPCTGAAAVIWAGEGRHGGLSTLLNWAPIQFFGDISYSLYLWHWPLLVYTRFLFGPNVPPSIFVIVLILAIALGYASYRLIERPFLSLAIPRFPVFRLAAGAIAAVAAVSGVLFYSKGALWRFPADVRAIYTAADDYNKRRSTCHGDGRHAIPYASNCRLGSEAVVPDTAVWGDSHGAELAAALGQRAVLANRSVMEISTSACPPIQNLSVSDGPVCVEQNADTLRGLIGDTTIRTVILTANIARYEPYRQQDILEKGLTATVDALLAANKRVVVVQQIPIMVVDPPAEAGRALMAHASLIELGASAPDYRGSTARWNSFLAKLASERRVELLDPANRLCDDRLCHMYKPGVGVLYFNESHLSVTGAAFMMQPLADEIYGKIE